MEKTKFEVYKKHWKVLVKLDDQILPVFAKFLRTLNFISAIQHEKLILVLLQATIYIFSLQEMQKDCTKLKITVERKRPPKMSNLGRLRELKRVKILPQKHVVILRYLRSFLLRLIAYSVRVHFLSTFKCFVPVKSQLRERIGYFPVTNFHLLYCPGMQCCITLLFNSVKWSFTGD